MEFSLRSAYAHGTRAIRTHLDAIPPQDAICFPGLRRAARANGQGRIDLQAACLIGGEAISRPTGRSASTADIVAAHGGVLGMVTYPAARRDRPHPRLPAAWPPSGGCPPISTWTRRWTRRRTRCAMIAEAVIETGFRRAGGRRPLLFRLARWTKARGDWRRWTWWPRRACMSSACRCATSTCRTATPTARPRRRGITLVHEMRARGINVSFASDNTRDPFYAYGDLDMVEVLREATRIGHLDHSGTDWVQSVPDQPGARLRLCAALAGRRRARRPRAVQGPQLDRVLRPPAIRPHRDPRRRADRPHVARLCRT